MKNCFVLLLLFNFPKKFPEVVLMVLVTSQLSQMTKYIDSHLHVIHTHLPSQMLELIAKTSYGHQEGSQEATTE